MSLSLITLRKGMGNFVSNSQQNNQTEPEKSRDVSMKSMTAHSNYYHSESYHRGKLWECMKTHSDYYQPIIAAAESADKAIDKEVEAVVLPSSVGRDVMEWRKDPKAREEVEKYCDFMERGACKESWIALAQCWDAADVSKEEKDKRMFMLFECTKAHSDYYHPLLEPARDKALDEQVAKEIEALFSTSSDQLKVGDDELTDRILEFMNGGACKESFTRWLDILMEEVEADTRNQSS